MIGQEVHRFSTIRTLVFAGLFGIGLAASTSLPALAQASGTWTTTGSLNTTRGGHTATLLQNGDVLVAGGSNSTGILTSAELYNPATGKWTVAGSMATRRSGHTATLLPNGDVLVAGGLFGTDSQFQPIYTATAELYHPSTGQWTSTGSMATPRDRQGATLLANGQVLVAGGMNSNGSAGTTAELYNPSTGMWNATGSTHNAHSSPLTLLQDDRALVAGGTGELYDSSTGQWTLTAPMYFGDGAAAALLTSGDVLTYGNHFPSYAAEFYNPFANTWSRTEGQSYTGVSFGPLTLLGTGKALLGGGVIVYAGKSTPVANCSLYDPSTNRWTQTGSLKQAGTHTLTVLLNGQVLAAGGDAELYTP